MSENVRRHVWSLDYRITLLLSSVSYPESGMAIRDIVSLHFVVLAVTNRIVVAYYVKSVTFVSTNDTIIFYVLFRMELKSFSVSGKLKSYSVSGEFSASVSKLKSHNVSGKSSVRVRGKLKSYSVSASGKLKKYRVN